MPPWYMSTSSSKSSESASDTWSSSCELAILRLHMADAFAQLADMLASVWLFVGAANSIDWRVTGAG
eukprot:CAMPEP_0183352454 /NCGR_PEP_ID=MMETSP0164_2-20130417/29450_1 /TAXON_ID=221442 /ORGANISM="Coccolithus pelagicus ssp braarudi, Strain PLY182g" /LENGTH=66 /DNA_ID=CAMNT_0025524889 /DNA_START=805 /DNA_END=1005 /DNA_ORIENTATION=+